MNQDPKNTLPLGDFKPSDQWQTHINSIFYGILGPGIHNHFQTYVSRDHRLAHTLAEDYFTKIQEKSLDGKIRFIQEWGVGNGNLAACFLTRLKKIDRDGRVYPNTHYILCDYSNEILKGARANPRLREHAGRFSTVRVDAAQLDCFKSHSVEKILSNEIWDDLATKVLLKHQDSLYEEYLQPHIDPKVLQTDFETFRARFNERDFSGLQECGPFLPAIVWERDYQRVDINSWPNAGTIRAQTERLADDIPAPINIGAFTSLKHAHHLLCADSQGYTGFDYGMKSIDELNREGRPYFNLYGGQYTFMVNFDLLAEVGKAIGFENVAKEFQHQFVGRHIDSKVASVVEIMQSHPDITQMAPWDRDILMLNTLGALNTAYRSPYKNKMEYPVMEGTPKKQRKQIAQLVKHLSPTGVPDTVAYVTDDETASAMTALKRLGYREKDVRRTFDGPSEPISFVYINFH